MRRKTALKYSDTPSRARFSWLTKPHDFLLKKSRHYYKWHCHPHHQKVHLAGLIASIIAIVFGSIAILFPAGFARATSYNFSQTSWSGGADVAATANHTSNQSNWTKYYSTSSLTATTNVKLTLTPSTAAETTATHFNAGTHTSTAESGAGDAGTVQLAAVASADAWTTPSMTNGPSGLINGSSMVAIGNTLYFAGDGQSTVYAFNTAAGTWSTLASTPATADYTVLLSNGTDLYWYNLSANTFYRYTMSSPGWTQLTAITSPSTASLGLQGTYWSGKFYLYEGTGNLARIYNIATDAWSNTANFTSPFAGGAGFTFTAYNNKLYSTMVPRYYSDFGYYNIATDAWIDTPTDLASEDGVLGMRAVTVGDYIFLPKGGTTTFRRYDIGGDSWGTKTAAPVSFNSTGSNLAYANGKIYWLLGWPSTAALYAYTVEGYQSSGNYVSQTIDLTSKATFGNLDFSVTTPANTTIQFQLAANNDNSTWSYVGPDGTASTYFSSTGTAIGSGLSGNRYVRYKTYLTTSNLAATPVLNDITINYSKYAASGTLISSPYDSLDPGNILNQVTWSETLSSGDIKFQLRTAPDSSGAPGTWSDWLGPTSTSDYYTAPTGSETINSTHSTGANDEWVQYKAFLSTTDTSVTPTMSNFSLQYILNTPPTATITNAPVESSAGVYTITYNLSDPEETSVNVYLTAGFGATLASGINSSDTSATLTADAGSAYTFLPTGGGTILIGNELIAYTSRSGTALSGLSRAQLNTVAASHSASAAVYLRVTGGLSGDTGLVLRGNGKSITWALASGINNLEVSNGTIKLFINDGNLANQVNSAETASLVMDSKAPTAGAIVLNSRTDTLTLSATDSNAISMKVSNDSGLLADGHNSDSGNWITYAGTKAWTPSTAGDRTETVYVAYKDAYGNSTGTINTTTGTNPVNVLIQDTSNPATSSWRLFISWDTVADPAAGFDHYEIYRSTDNNSYSALATVGARLTNYYVNTSLDNVTVYYYKITTVDLHNNESNYSTPSSSAAQAAQSGTGLMPNGSGGGDFTAPVISVVTAGTPTTTALTLTWTTDEVANSTVGYSTDTGYLNEVGVPTMTASHSVALSNLNVHTKYYFRVISYDASGNKATAENSETQYFTTAADTTGPVISNINVSAGTTTAGVAWSTDEASNSQVDYGLTSGLGTTSTSVTMVAGHSVQLTGLTSNTTYYYTVNSTDASSNATTSETATFTTAVTGSENADVTAPSISTGTVSDTSATSVTISFTLGENALGRIIYGTTTAYGLGSNEGNNNYETSKSAVLAGLTANTSYHYKISAVDTAGNLGSTGDATFTTTAEITSDTTLAEATSIVEAAPDPTLKDSAVAPRITSDGPAMTAISEKSATISWATDKRSTSSVLYRIVGSGNDFATAGDTNYSRAHDVTLILEPSQLYEYKIQSADISGNLAASNLYNFVTLSGTVSSVQVGDVTESSAKITWATAALSTGTVEYNSGLDAKTLLLTSDNLGRNHSLTLPSLTSDSRYNFTVVMKTERGDIIRSNTYSFATLPDKAAPAITNVQNRTTLVAGSNSAVQLVLTWTTNKPADGIVTYAENSLENKSVTSTPVSTDFVLSHTIVISNLKPSMMYQYYITSKDKAGHSVKSDKFNLLTPAPNANIVDLIFERFKKAFGWASKL